MFVYVISFFEKRNAGACITSFDEEAKRNNFPEAITQSFFRIFIFVEFCHSGQYRNLYANMIYVLIVAVAKGKDEKIYPWKNLEHLKEEVKISIVGSFFRFHMTEKRFWQIFKQSWVDTEP